MFMTAQKNQIKIIDRQGQRILSMSWSHKEKYQSNDTNFCHGFLPITFTLTSIS